MESRIPSEIAKLQHKYGIVPPPWVICNEHPYSICWRMGIGESHLMVWSAWWGTESFDEEQRIAYFHQWKPPHCWLEWTIDAIREPNPSFKSDFDYTPYFSRLEILGFGSQADFERDLEDPKWLNTEI